MYLLKTLESGKIIAAYSIFVYSVAFINLFATLMFENFGDWENKEEENTDQRYTFYLTLCKILLLIFFLIMVIISINLLRGIVKRSLALILSWLMLSFSVLVYQVIFLSDQLLFYFAYGYTIYSPLVLLGVFILLGLQILSIIKIMNFFMDLYRNNTLQCVKVSTTQNSPFDSKNYIRNLIKNDPSVLTPLNEEEYINQYKQSNSVNLNNFEI